MTSFLLILFHLLFAGLPDEPVQDESDRMARAEASLEVLVERFWNDELEMFNNAMPCEACNTQFHYWWQAHAMDVLLDGYELTGDDHYLELVERLYEGLLERNGGDLYNNYYDDMLWMGLALHRAYTLTGRQEYLDRAVELWEEIRISWNDEFGGGIPWRRSQLDYKNAPSNGPAVILAARLYQTTGEETYLVWANRIYTWLKDTLVDPETGLVWDGINRQGNGEIDRNWMFTYNQGTFTGAGLEMWRATGEDRYLDDAERNVHAASENLTNDRGIFRESGQGDGGLFKGILVRYFVDFDRVVGGDMTLRTVLLHNAESAWEVRQESGIFGPNWEEIHNGAVDLSSHLSGVKLMVLTTGY